MAAHQWQYAPHLAPRGGQNRVMPQPRLAEVVECARHALAGAEDPLRQCALPGDQGLLLEPPLVSRAVQGRDAQLATVGLWHHHDGDIRAHDVPRACRHDTEPLAQLHVCDHLVGQLEEQLQARLLALERRVPQRIIHCHSDVLCHTREKLHLLLRVVIRLYSGEMQAAEPPLGGRQGHGARGQEAPCAQEALHARDARVVVQPRDHRGPLLVEDPRRVHGLYGRVVRWNQPRRLRAIEHIPARAAGGLLGQKQTQVVENRPARPAGVGGPVPACGGRQGR
jgi:hypothetical protein